MSFASTTVMLRFTEAAKRKSAVKLTVSVRFGNLDGSPKVTLKR